MGATNYSPELCERAVRMVAEVRPDYSSDWSAICAVAARLGIGSAETERVQTLLLEQWHRARRYFPDNPPFAVALQRPV